MKYVLYILFFLTVLYPPAFSLELNPDNLEFGRLDFSETLVGEDKLSEVITLNAGDVMEVLNFSSSKYDHYISAGYASSVTDGGVFTIMQSLDGGNTFQYALNHTDHINNSSTVRNAAIGTHLVGPALICLAAKIPEYRSDYSWYNDSNTGSNSVTMSLQYAIQRKSSLSYKNINMISVPENSVGDGLELLVEASSDLQTWTPVHSSSVSGDKAFFRTRIVNSGE